MKKLILITGILISIALSFAYEQNDFGTIWKKGYVDGYCYDIPYCIEPIPPIPPVPRIQDTSYVNIYNRGFLSGFRANTERE